MAEGFLEEQAEMAGLFPWSGFGIRSGNLDLTAWQMMVDPELRRVVRDPKLS